MIRAERAARLEAEAVAAGAKAEAANAKAAEALISYLKLEIEKLRRQIYGSRSERKARLLEQMELQLEELEATATEDELAAERAAARTETVKSFQRKRPARKPFPITCRVSGSWSPHRRAVPAAAHRSCQSWAKI
jgi:transposase